MVQQLLVLCGSWKSFCDQRVQVAQSLGPFVLRERIGFTEESFALRGAEIVQGAGEDRWI